MLAAAVAPGQPPARGDILTRGRKPVPTALRLISGNPSKRPLKKHEPKPVTSIPTCPAHLMPTAKAEWKRLADYLHKFGIISELDRARLAAYCQAYRRWIDAEKKLKETPPLLPRAHSRCGMADQSVVVRSLTRANWR